MRIPIIAAIMLAMDRNTPRPIEIKLHQASRVLEVTFDDGRQFRLPFEYLRAISPSAEVRAHGPGQEALQPGKPVSVVSAVVWVAVTTMIMRLAYRTVPR